MGQTSNFSWHEKRTFPNDIVLLTLFSSNLIIFKIYNGIIYNIRILSSMSYIGNSWLMTSFMKVKEYQFFKEKKCLKNTHFSIQEPHKTKSGLRGHLNSTNLKDIFRG